MSSQPKYEPSHKIAQFKHEPMPYMLYLVTKKASVIKSHPSEAFDLTTIIGMLKKMERPFFPTEIEARRELSRLGLIS